MSTAWNDAQRVLSDFWGRCGGDFDKRLFAYLNKPDRVVESVLRVRRDDGSFVQLDAYRSQHNNLRGPYKGGLRFHSGVDVEEVKALSLWINTLSYLSDT